MNALKGKILAITRNEQDAQEFFRLVASEGGKAIALPAIEIVPMGREASNEFLEKLRYKKHDYCAFMSPQTVRVLFDSADGKHVLRSLGDTKVVAVGPKTKAVLEEHGIRVDLVPDEFSSGGLVNMLSSVNPSGKKIIIPRSVKANKYVASSLQALGMEVEEVYLYTVRTSESSPVWQDFYCLLRQRMVAALIFTSGSSVDSFFQIIEGIAHDLICLDALTKVISIGPSTSSALKSRNIEYHEGRVHTVKGAFDLARRVAIG